MDIERSIIELIKSSEKQLESIDIVFHFEFQVDATFKAIASLEEKKLLNRSWNGRYHFYEVLEPPEDGKKEEEGSMAIIMDAVASPEDIKRLAKAIEADLEDVYLDQASPPTWFDYEETLKAIIKLGFSIQKKSVEGVLRKEGEVVNSGKFCKSIACIWWDENPEKEMPCPACMAYRYVEWLRGENLEMVITFKPKDTNQLGQ